MAQIYVLGAGTPTPTADRFGSAFVLEFSDRQRLMFDCGPAATHKLAKMGLEPTDISHLFFTHHHFDHDVDYPCFLLTRWDQTFDWDNGLTVLGPPLTEQLTHRLIDEDDGAFAADWKARQASTGTYRNRGGTVFPRPKPEVDVRDLDPEGGPVIDGDGWSVTSARAEHVQPYLDSLAYRVESDEGTVVFTGDTRPCPAVTELAQDADVMVCMCWDDQELMDQVVGNRPNTGMGTLGAAEMAQAAGVKKLVLTHIGRHLDQQGPMLKAFRDIAAVYDGEVVFSEELMRVPVGDPQRPHLVRRSTGN